MRQCVIFGCGQVGNAAYIKLRELYNVIAWSDNNSELWGKRKENRRIIAPSELQNMCINIDLDVVVAVSLYKDICSQLERLKIENIILWKVGFLYLYKNNRFYPLKADNKIYHTKGHDKGYHILFVQTSACIRTHKIAKALKKRGINVSLAFLTESPAWSNCEYAKIYDNIYPVISMEQFIDFVNKSEFDFVHSSNEPDFLTMLLNQTNKAVIHDCHDLSSAYIRMSPEELFIEYAANKKSRGVIYTTEGIRNEALKKFDISVEKTFVLENLISEELMPNSKYEKLSRKDHEMHCVYEGGVIPHDHESHRYFEDIWRNLAEHGIHVHFYTTCNKEYCKYLESLHEKIHYEGNLSSQRLAAEMTKYDVGLCILNVTEKNKQYLEYASPNKIQEYVNAGIPVAVGAIESQRDFVESNRFGRQIDMKGNIYEQIRSISLIPIEDGILGEKGFTLESRIDDLICFYEKCVKGSI